MEQIARFYRSCVDAAARDPTNRSRLASDLQGYAAAFGTMEAACAMASAPSKL